MHSAKVLGIYNKMKKTLRVYDATTSQHIGLKARALLRSAWASYEGVPKCVRTYAHNMAESAWMRRYPFQRVVVADDDESVLGVMLGCPEKNTFGIHFVATDPTMASARADVIYDLLLDAAHAECVTERYPRMWVWCGEWFTEGIARYERYGFVVKERQQNWEESEHYSRMYVYEIRKFEEMIK
jgi:hypothetical protein